jgi:hypothetical protein
MRGITLTILFLSASLALVQAQTVRWNGNNWALNCDFIGNDFAQVRVSSDRCGGACVENTQCTHFAWTEWNGGTCWLKRGPITRANAVVSNIPNIVCGVIRESTG